MKQAGRLGRILLAAVMLSSACLSVWAQAKSAGHVTAKQAPTKIAHPSQQFPTIRYEKYKLPNGLEVILSQDHRLPLVAVDLWYHVGPANERPGRTGFAHLFEHMMFQGSKHVGDRPFQVLEGAGATLINGTTDFDRTNYFETMPSNQLETALWLESDRMGWLLDKLDEKKLANQRDVVRNERRQGESQPYMLPEEGLYQALFPQGHPYHGVVIGSHADIESAELNDVRNFFKQYYAPNNASLAIVGDFDPKTIRDLVEKYFGPVPAGPPIPNVDATVPKITAEKRLTIPDKVKLPRVFIGWITPPIYTPGNADADLLARILGGGKSSRLYKKLVYEKQIAQDVDVSVQDLILGSVFEITATAKPGIKIEELEKAIDQELAAIQHQGVSKAELERARNTIQTRMIEGLQRLGGFGGVADMLNQYNHYLHDPGYLPKDLARYENATPASVLKLAQSLTPNARVVVHCVPGEKVLHDVPKRPEPQVAQTSMPGGPGNDEWRNTPPKPGAEKAPNLPSAKEFALENGMKVYLVEQHHLPVIAAQLTVLRGSDSNPVDKPGLASFTAKMLTEGTEKRTAPQLADDVAQIGARLDASSSADASLVRTSGLTRNSDRMFDLLSDVMLHPAFRQEEIERQRKLRLTELLQQNDDPNTLASKFFYHAVYSAGSPYGFLETGTVDATKATTRDDITRFYASGYGPKNAALVVSGDITEAQLKSLAEKYFDGWTGTASPSKPPQVSSTPARHIMIVDMPGSPQSVLRIGQVGLARDNPDYVPVTIMNRILGGMFSSRINLNLREAHGYTYGAFSTFAFRRGAGPFYVGSMVRTDVTAPAVKEVFAELTKMRASAVTPEELAMAKEKETQALPGLFEVASNTASTISNLFVYNLPLDYYRTLPGKIEVVDTAEVQNMAAKYLTPEKMVVVIAGYREKIEPELKKLELGPTEAQDAEGKPIAEKPTVPGK